MSSGFVFGGTIDQPVTRDDEWLKAQQELEAIRLRKEEGNKKQDGKSLYEVLQQNKAAKQDAFEESIRLKNQFRNLDEDEVEFLDSVLESTRVKEEAVKKETKAQLEIFRRQQEEIDRTLMAENADNKDERDAWNPSLPIGEDAQWAVNARKRKRIKEKEALRSAKFRRPSSISDTAASVSIVDSTPPVGSKQKFQETKEPPSDMSGLSNQKSTTVSAKLSGPVLPKKSYRKPDSDPPNLGLGGYDSDDDDE